MKKLLIILFVVIVFSSGCTQAPTENAEPTESVKEATQTATATASPTKTPEPTATLTPAPTPVPTVKQEYINISEVNETLNVDVIARSRFSFGGELINWSNQIVATEDDSGNIYFTRDGDLQKLDITTNKVSVEYKKDEILSDYSENTFNDTSKYVGVHFTQGKLFAVIQTEVVDDVYDYVVVSISDKNISLNHLNHLNHPIGYYDSMVLDVRNYSDKNERYSYRMYDFITDKFYNLDFSTLKNDMVSINKLLFATDRYIVLQGFDTPYDSEEAYSENPYIYFINTETFELEAKISNMYSNWIGYPEIIKFQDDLFYFYNINTREIKTLNIKTGEVNSLYEFKRFTRYVSFDSDENYIYFKQRYNYNHGPYFTSRHGKNSDTQTYRDCFEFGVLDNAYDIYFKFSLDDSSYETLNKVNIKEQMNPNLYCIEYMIDYKLGEYILSYYPNLDKDYLRFNSFNFMLKLGEFKMTIKPRLTKK